MRAGFSTYRAFRQDREDFQKHMKESPKLAMPVLAAAGSEGFMAEVRSIPVKASLMISPVLRGYGKRVLQRRQLCGGGSIGTLDARGESRGFRADDQ